jgi:hypothetical protein
MSNNKFTLAVLVIAVSVITLSCLLIRGCAYYEYSEGSRSGVITKFSRRGLIWKTWEGEMALGGLRQTSQGAVANVWHFSLDRRKVHGENIEQLSAEIDKAKDSGERIRLEYKQSIISLPWRSSTKYYVQSASHKQ